MIKHLIDQKNGIEFYVYIDSYTNLVKYVIINTNDYNIMPIEFSDYIQAENKFNELKNNKVNHKYQFKTSVSWEPQTDACWVECPFSFNIDIGRSCKCMNPETDYKCPFVEDGMIDDECYE